MIPLALWSSEEMKKRRENAVAKALKEKPSVIERVKLGPISDLPREFRVKDYYVHLTSDADGQLFIECDCLAGSPPIDEATGLPSREAVPCYHGASVLIHIAEEEKEQP